MDLSTRFSHLPKEQQEQAMKAFSGGKPKKQSPANALTDAIRNYCKLLGCATARINVMGIFDKEKGSFRTSGSTKGVEDNDITLPVYIFSVKVGVKVAVEVKIGKDKQSEDQKKRQAEIERAGGHYIIAKTFDEFKQDFDKIKHYYEQFR